MRLIVRFLRACTNFFFPKSQKIIELENLSSGEILKILPPAEEIEDKNIIALFDYRHPLVREIVWSIKYRGDRTLSKKLAEIIGDVIEHELSERALFENLIGSSGGHRPVLVPVPVSDKRRFERGWNQAEILGQAVKQCLGESIKYLPNQLVKYRHTESQTKTSNKSERQRNLKDSMRVLHSGSVEGRIVILLDDVTTTGSTFREARRALKEAGVKHVLCVAVAH